MTSTDCPRHEWLVFNSYDNPMRLVDYPCTCGLHADAQPSSDAAIVAALPGFYRLTAHGVAVPVGL